MSLCTLPPEVSCCTPRPQEFTPWALGEQEDMVESSFYEPSNPKTSSASGISSRSSSPPCALRPMLGGAPHAALRALLGWQRHRGGIAYKEGPSIFRMRVRLLRNTDVLDPAILGQRHFA
jgi:hypothetical protein